MPPASQEEQFRAIRNVVKRAKLGVSCFPTTPGHSSDMVTRAAEADLDFIRVLVHQPEIDVSAIRNAICRSVALRSITCVNFMKSYASSPDKISVAAHKSRDLDAVWVYIVDSAGCMLPKGVARYCEAMRPSFPHMCVGYHGHNNLPLALANSTAAIEAGATFVDSSLQGLGRAMGNTPIEALLAAMQTRGKESDINAEMVGRLGSEVVRKWVRPGFDPIHVTAATARIHSESLDGIARQARRLFLSTYAALAAIGRA